MRMMKHGLRLASMAACALVAMPMATSAQVNFGSEGEPVNLVVGYQPYYTESWSGVVMNGKEFWRDHLPEGSSVRFEVGLQGAVIVNAMTGEQQHIGYVGDMPAIASTFRYLPDRGRTDIRIVGVLGTSKQQCNIFLVSNQAPEFANGREAVEWMDGKVTASPHGSCTDRFAQSAFKETGITPASYLNQNIEVITTNFRARKLDAAVIWEPTASKMVEDGIARRVASGEDFDALDGGFLIMLHSLIEQRPDIVRSWLEAELDAQLFMADPAHASEIAHMAQQQTEQMPHKVLWKALYGSYPPEQGGGEIKVQLDFIVTDRVRGLLDEAVAFLYEMPQRPAAEPTLREGAVMDDIAREVLESRGLTSPIGVIEAMPDEAYEEFSG